MSTMSRISQSVCLIALGLVMNGCGAGSLPTTVAEGTPISSTQVAAGSSAGSIVASVPLTAIAPLQAGASKTVTAISIPSGATIIPPAGTTFSATTPPVINVTTPGDNMTTAAAGLPKVTPSGTAFTVESSAGAVDISLSGASSFTLSSPATVKVPVNQVLTNPVDVYTVKANGTTTKLSGTYSVENGNKIVSVSVADFCWIIIKPKFLSTTGLTGSGGQ